MKIRPIANYTLLIASYLLLRIICAVLMKTSAVGEKKKKKKVQERTDVQHLQNTANKDTVLLSWKCVKYMKDLYVFTILIIPDIIN